MEDVSESAVHPTGVPATPERPATAAISAPAAQAAASPNATTAMAVVDTGRPADSLMVTVSVAQVPPAAPAAPGATTVSVVSVDRSAPADPQCPATDTSAAPQTTGTALPHWWRPATGWVTAALAVLTLFVAGSSPLLTLDRHLYDLHLIPSASHWSLAVAAGVFLGQRVTATVLAGWYVWHRARTDGRPEVVVFFLLAEIGFVAAVVTLKYSTGRIGPRYTDDAFAVLAGGNIFPSGHVTGATALYGAAALIAPVAMRKLAIACAALLSISIGLGTIALNTHWATDVLGGWLLGVLVLLVAWAATPRVDRWRREFFARRLSRRAELPG